MGKSELARLCGKCDQRLTLFAETMIDASSTTKSPDEFQAKLVVMADGECDKGDGASPVVQR